MNVRLSDAPAPEDPHARLERAFIDEYLRARGYGPGRLQELGGDHLRRLLAEASAYASARLAELESRAHFVHEIHGDSRLG